MTSEDGRFTAEFAPKLLRKEDANALLIRSSTRQFYGRYSGTFRMEDGRSIAFRDLFGFAEQCRCRW